MRKLTLGILIDEYRRSTRGCFIDFDFEKVIAQISVHVVWYLSIEQLSVIHFDEEVKGS